MNLWASFMSVLRGIIGSKEASVGVTMAVEDTFYRKYNVSKDGIAPEYIVIHHSFSADGHTRDWDGIRKYHMSYRYQGNIISEHQYHEYQAAGKSAGLERPWKDIGYHLGIEEVNGEITVQDGRPIRSPGAHALGLPPWDFNRMSIGICVIGNYDAGEPGPDRIFKLASVCRDLQRLFIIPKKNVIGHRDTYQLRGVPVEKTCPGSRFDLELLRDRLI